MVTCVSSVMGRWTSGLFLSSLASFSRAYVSFSRDFTRKAPHEGLLVIVLQFVVVIYTVHLILYTSDWFVINKVDYGNHFMFTVSSTILLIKDCGHGCKCEQLLVLLPNFSKFFQYRFFLTLCDIFISGNMHILKNIMTSSSNCYYAGVIGIFSPFVPIIYDDIISILNLSYIPSYIPISYRSILMESLHSCCNNALYF